MMADVLISFDWDVEANILYRSEMEVPEELLKDEQALKTYIEDNIQFNKKNTDLRKVNDINYGEAYMIAYSIIGDVPK